jgi:hypothetical protein
MQWAVVSLRCSPTRAYLLRRIQEGREDSPEETVLVVVAAVMVAVLWIWRQVERGE